MLTDPARPTALERWEIANFKTLQKACNRRDLCLCQMYRKNGKRELVVCAVSTDPQADVKYFVPLALMFNLEDGNPYELFNANPFQNPTDPNDVGSPVFAS